jgi:uncharacterized membrane protein (DUF2068 family)
MLDKIKKEVPKGVKAIAIYYYLSAGISLLIALSLILFNSLILPWLVKTFVLPNLNNSIPLSSSQELITMFSIVMIIALVTSAVFSFIIGISLWKLKKWARVVSIVSTGIGILSSGISLLFALMSVNILKIALYVPSLAISIWIFSYLLSNEKVIKAFA